MENTDNISHILTQEEEQQQLQLQLMDNSVVDPTHQFSLLHLHCCNPSSSATAGCHFHHHPSCCAATASNSMKRRSPFPSSAEPSSKKPSSSSSSDQEEDLDLRGYTPVTLPLTLAAADDKRALPPCLKRCASDLTPSPARAPSNSDESPDSMRLRSMKGSLRVMRQLWNEVMKDEEEEQEQQDDECAAADDKVFLPPQDEFKGHSEEAVRVEWAKKCLRIIFGCPCGKIYEDVHETAAGALWNLAFNPGNALRIVEEGGVSALVNLCSSSVSKMARFMAALALAYMFDGRMDEFALVGTSSESTSKSVSLDGARRMVLKNIEAFVLMFSHPQTFAAAAASSAPAALAQVTEGARIQEAGHLRCSGAEIGRFVTMLRNPSSILKACAAFALLQFTIPGGRHATHHASLMQNAGAARVLRGAAAAATAPLEAKIFARIVLRNLEHHQIEHTV